MINVHVNFYQNKDFDLTYIQSGWSEATITFKDNDKFIDITLDKTQLEILKDFISTKTIE